MFRLTILALLAGVSFAQNADDPFNRPPAEVDQALRARIAEFYQYHVDKEFRKAEALVAEDTKEFYYSHNKPGYLSFQIVRIDYSDNFTRAKAVVNCEQYVMFPGFADRPIKAPIPSTWKVVDGKWYWYVDPEALRMTPFGKMTPGAGPASVPIPAMISQNTDFVMKLVKTDKDSVSLRPGQSEAVTIMNGAPGNMTVTILGSVPGVEATLDHASLKIGDKAVLTLKAGEGVRPGQLNVRVEETGVMLPIRVLVR